MTYVRVARGSYAYSLMFYPLLTLGAEQLLRVVEGAIAYEFKGWLKSE
jgi:hypothetical protein